MHCCWQRCTARGECAVKAHVSVCRPLFCQQVSALNAQCRSFADVTPSYVSSLAHVSNVGVPFKPRLLLGLGDDGMDGDGDEGRGRWFWADKDDNNGHGRWHGADKDEMDGPGVWHKAGMDGDNSRGRWFGAHEDGNQGRGMWHTGGMDGGDGHGTWGGIGMNGGGGRAHHGFGGGGRDGFGRRRVSCGLVGSIILEMLELQL